MALKLRRVFPSLFKHKVTAVAPMSTPVGIAYALRMTGCCVCGEHFGSPDDEFRHIDIDLHTVTPSKETMSYKICFDCYSNTTEECGTMLREDAPLYINSENMFIKHYAEQLILRG